MKMRGTMTYWRYYILLNNSEYAKFTKAVKDNTLTRSFLDFNLGKRQIDVLYNAKDKSEFTKLVKLYQTRMAQSYKLLQKTAPQDAGKTMNNAMNIMGQGLIDLGYMIRSVMRYSGS